MASSVRSVNPCEANSAVQASPVRCREGWSSAGGFSKLPGKGRRARSSANRGRWARLGAAPRYGTARCAATVRVLLSDARWKARIAEWIPPDIAEQVPLDLLGLITGLPAEMAQIPWDGPQVRIVEHQAHAPGHAALLIEERGVLVAGDMLSDVLIPMLDLNDTADPIEDYLAALRLLEGVAGDVDVLVPGHGSIGGADQVRARIDQDRAYVHALRDAGAPGDPRVGPSATFGKDWLPGVHERQLQRLARRGERDGTPG
jgi:glyoxylase-like metal-dependent hydrolase (beta-lactamase superfamily II)